MLLTMIRLLICSLLSLQEEPPGGSGHLDVLVTDSAGAPIPKAKVELYYGVPAPYSGLKHKVQWANGELLSFGDYELHVSHPGMKSTVSRVSMSEARKGIVVGLEVGRITSFQEVSVWFVLAPEMRACVDLVLTPVFLSDVERRKARLTGTRTEVLGLVPGDYVALLYDGNRRCAMQYVPVRRRESIVLRASR